MWNAELMAAIKVDHPFEAASIYNPFFYNSQCTPIVMASPPQRPHTQGGYHPDGSQIVYGHEASSARSPLSGTFLKDMQPTDKKMTKDGQPPKRRGPKPDSKPALTRRQELNRQAQRTHRERKEQYIKALELEVTRIREEFVEISRERATVLEENQRLKEILAAHGIAYDLSSPPNIRNTNTSSYHGSSAASMSGSYGHGTTSTGYTSPPQVPNVPNLPGSQVTCSPNTPGMGVSAGIAQQPNPGMNYDQVGIDFVLTYDRTPYLSPPPQ